MKNDDVKNNKTSDICAKNNENNSADEMSAHVGKTATNLRNSSTNEILKKTDEESGNEKFSHGEIAENSATKKEKTKESEKNSGRFWDVCAKGIRVLTLPPIAALAALIVLFVNGIADVAEFVLGIVGLCVIPTSAYAFEPLFRKNRNKRNSQRGIAQWFSLAGYSVVNIFAWCVGSQSVFKIFLCTYLLSVLALIASDRLFDVRSSGHACGFVGPIVFLGVFVNPWYFAGMSLFGGLFWASLRMKRHTVSELVCGAVIPVAAMCASYLIFGL